MNNKLIVTIDGWSSCGKSTLARQLARKLNYIYIDSGAMYRAITLFFLRNHINWSDTSEVVSALKEISLEFQPNAASGNAEIFLNDENVEFVIRDLVVAEKVSEVATIGEVREFAVEAQKKMGKDKGIVMDGRDIGTTVFPDADVKLFMTADEEVRVTRRYQELFEKNPNITIAEVKNNLQLRDYIDSHRDISPLRQAEDAIKIDNSHLSIKDQLELALEIVRKKIGENL